MCIRNAFCLLTHDVGIEDCNLMVLHQSPLAAHTKRCCKTKKPRSIMMHGVASVAALLTSMGPTVVVVVVQDPLQILPSLSHDATQIQRTHSIEKFFPLTIVFPPTAVGGISQPLTAIPLQLVPVWFAKPFTMTWQDSGSDAASRNAHPDNCQTGISCTNVSSTPMSSCVSCS
jgi:hypothetical protein